MYLLKFFLEWGPKGLGALWLAYLIPAAILTIQAYKGSKSGWYQSDNVSPLKEGEENISMWGSNKMLLVYGLTFVAVLIHCAIRYEWFD